MERFAKIIETPTTQVLFFLEFDDDDHTILHSVGRVNGVAFDVKTVFDYEAKAVAALEKRDVEFALNLVAQITDLTT